MHWRCRSCRGSAADDQKADYGTTTELTNPSPCSRLLAAGSAVGCDASDRRLQHAGSEKLLPRAASDGPIRREVGPVPDGRRGGAGHADLQDRAVLPDGHQVATKEAFGVV